MTPGEASALGIVDWFIAIVRERAGLRPLRTDERPRAWDYPPPPPPPARDELAEAWRAVSRDWSRVVPRDIAVDQLALLIAERAELRAEVAVLEAENAALRSQLADRRGEYR